MNYAELKARRVFSAGVPAQVGGGGASAELSEMLHLRALLQLDSLGALDAHLVATAAWRWRHEGAPVEPLLRRVAAEESCSCRPGIRLSRRQRHGPESRRRLW
jgi:hypothetical protein